MDMSKYDYILDFSITGLTNNHWLFLRFNDDSGGLISWDSCLIFNPNGPTFNTINIAEGVYNNSAHGNSVYWLNGGQGAGAGQEIQVKASYKISAVSFNTFVVSLEQCQPVGILPGLNNVSPNYKVFASQIKYRYNNLNATRWAPANIGFFTNLSASFSNLNCCITQCIKSTVAITH